MHVIRFSVFLIYLIFLSYSDLISLLRNFLYLPLALQSSHPFISAYAFNIDEKYPIVISNRFNGINAYFGSSVVLLPSSNVGQQTTKFIGANNGDKITGYVLIGAPKANSSLSNHSKIFEPGVIWRCSLGQHHESNANEICKIVEIDPTGEYDPYDPNLPFRDRKDGGWLGGSMFVGDSDRFVACASRWINQKYTNLYLLNGICYWLPKSNMTVNSNDPKWPWLPEKLSYRLTPLLNKTKQYHKETSAKIIANLDRSIVFNWALGQFGFSIHLTPNNELISGCPGVFDWTGSIVYYRDSLGPQPHLRRYNAHPSSPAFSEMLVVPTQTMSPVLQTYDYFGYSVTSGKFFISKNQTQFASGAPRASHLSGKVVVFTLKEVAGGRSEGKMDLLVDPIEGRNTKGNHYGSYFGHSVLALDVNGDGFDDLLVTAPLYGTSVRYKRNVVTNDGGGENQGDDLINEEVPKTKMKNGDEGCIFIYRSNGEEFHLTPQDFCGDKISGARFGMSISSLRDINRDGFNDFAVGAPFENDGHGAVYIYHGGKDYVTFQQKLKPELIDPKIRTFGGSLSLGVDIDENGYPDLAVGAYESNKVIIYRTIPVVNFTTLFTASIPKLLSTTEEFNLTTCITYSGHGRIPNVLAIWVKLTIEVEADGRKLVALVDNIGDGEARFLHNPSLQNKSIPNSSQQRNILLLSYQRRLFFRKDGTDSCYDFLAARVGAIETFSRSVPIRLDYWLDDYDDHRTQQSKPLYYEIQRSQTSPAVNLSQSASQFADFFHSKLQMPSGKLVATERLNLPVGTICEADGDPECLANLTISAWLEDPQTGKKYNFSEPFLLGTTDILTVHVELTNYRETASLPVTLTLKWLLPPVVRRLPASCEHVTKDDSFRCSINRAIKENQTETIIIDLDMSGVYGKPNQPSGNVLNISLTATTSSALVKPAIYNMVVPLETSVKPQGFSHTAPKIEYSVGNTSILTFGFTQAFEVGLIGPTSAAKVKVTFDIPVGLLLPESKSIDGGEEYYQIIGVKKPIITYDGKMECKAVNGAFFNDSELKNFIDVTGSTETDDNSNDNDMEINEITGIVQDKIKRLRRSFLSEVSSSEQRAEKDLNINDTNYHDYTYGGILKLSCDRSVYSLESNVKITCLRVICMATHFTPSNKAVVEFKLRMFNKVAAKLLLPKYYNFLSRLVDHGEYDDVGSISSLSIQSVGEVRTLSVDEEPFGDIGHLQFTSRLEIPPPYDLPAWILIVSVAGGLLLLTIVTLCLKKCGFFRRSKRDELVRRKIEEFERSKLAGAKKTTTSNSSTPSTLRVQTSSSSQHSTKENGHSKSYVNGRNKYERTTVTVNPTYSGGNADGSILAISSPGTVVKQKEIPGAVDLNELRRLYDYADDKQFH